MKLKKLQSYFLSLVIFINQAELLCMMVSMTTPAITTGMEALLQAADALIVNFCSSYIAYTKDVNVNQNLQALEKEITHNRNERELECIINHAAIARNVAQDKTKAACQAVLANIDTLSSFQASQSHNSSLPIFESKAQAPVFVVESPISVVHSPTSTSICYKDFHATLHVNSPTEVSWVKAQMMNQTEHQIQRIAERRVYNDRLHRDPAFRNYIAEQLTTASIIIRKAVYDTSFTSVILARLLMNKLSLPSYHGEILDQTRLVLNAYCFDDQGVVNGTIGIQEQLIAFAQFASKTNQDWYEVLCCLPIPGIQQACNNINRSICNSRLRRDVYRIKNNKVNEKLHEFIILCSQGLFVEAKRLMSDLPHTIAQRIYNEQFNRLRKYFYNEHEILRAYEGDPVWRNLSLKAKQTIAASQGRTKLYNAYLAERHRKVQVYFKQIEEATFSNSINIKEFLYSIIDCPYFEQAQKILTQIIQDEAFYKVFCWPNGILRGFVKPNIAKKMAVPKWLQQNPEYMRLVNQLLILTNYIASKKIKVLSLEIVNRILHLSEPLPYGKPNLSHIFYNYAFDSAKDQAMIQCLTQRMPVPILPENGNDKQSNQSSGKEENPEDEEEDDSEDEEILNDTIIDQQLTYLDLENDDTRTLISQILAPDLRQELIELYERKKELEEFFNIPLFEKQEVKDLLYEFACCAENQYVQKLHDLETRAEKDPSLKENLEKLKTYLPDNLRTLASHFDNIFTAIIQNDAKLDKAKSTKTKANLEKQNYLLLKSISNPFDVDTLSASINEQARLIIDQYGNGNEPFSNIIDGNPLQRHIHKELVKAINTIAADPYLEERKFPEKFFESTLDLMNIAQEAATQGEYDKACTILHFLQTTSQFSQYAYGKGSRTFDYVENTIDYGTDIIAHLPDEYKDVIQAGAYAILADFDDVTKSTILSNIATTQEGEFKRIITTANIFEHVENIMGYVDSISWHLLSLQSSLSGCASGCPWSYAWAGISSCLILTDFIGFSKEMSEIRSKQFVVHSDGRVSRLESPEGLNLVSKAHEIASQGAAALNVGASALQLGQGCHDLYKICKMAYNVKFNNNPLGPPKISSIKNTGFTKKVTKSKVSKSSNSRIKNPLKKVKRFKGNTVHGAQQAKKRTTRLPKNILNNSKEFAKVNRFHPECSYEQSQCPQKTCLNRLKLYDKNAPFPKMRGKQKGPWDKNKPYYDKPKDIKEIKAEIASILKKGKLKGYGVLEGKNINLNTLDHSIQPQGLGSKKDRPSGWHSDQFGIFERNKRVNGKEIEIISKRKGKSGTYALEWRFKDGACGRSGPIVKTSSMWPKNMSYAEIELRKLEAYRYCEEFEIAHELDLQTQALFLKGYSKDGIGVILVLDFDGNAITSFPVVD